MYPSLVSDSEIRQNQSRKSSDGDDDLWMPHGEVDRQQTSLPCPEWQGTPLLLSLPSLPGPVTLVKGSIASSPRKKRNARKRSFEQSLSATAAKILKMEQEKGEEEEEDEEEEAMKPEVRLLHDWAYARPMGEGK